MNHLGHLMESFSLGTALRSGSLCRVQYSVLAVRPATGANPHGIPGDGSPPLITPLNRLKCSQLINTSSVSVMIMTRAVDRVIRDPPERTCAYRAPADEMCRLQRSDGPRRIDRHGGR